MHVSRGGGGRTTNNFNLRTIPPPPGSDVAWIIKLRKLRYHELRARPSSVSASQGNNFWVTKRTDPAVTGTYPPPTPTTYLPSSTARHSVSRHSTNETRHLHGYPADFCLWCRWHFVAHAWDLAFPIQDVLSFPTFSPFVRAISSIFFIPRIIELSFLRSTL